MKLPLSFLAIAAALAACSSDQDSGVLNGAWEDGSMQVFAAPNGVVMTLQCGAIIHINHAVVPDGSGTFIVLDSLRGSLAGGLRDTLPGGPPPVAPAEVIGQVTGDQLTIYLNLSGGGTGGVTAFGAFSVFNGRRGQPGSSSGGTICRA